MPVQPDTDVLGNDFDVYLYDKDGNGMGFNAVNPSGHAHNEWHVFSSY